MPDRQGQLSTFPVLDQFAIKKSYDFTKSLAQQDASALEEADHFNHYFDAIVKIQNYVMAGSGGVGGQVVSIGDSGTISNCVLAYSTLTATMTGNTVTVTGLVPSHFSSDPFANPAFAMGTTTYVVTRNSTGNTEGVWANTSWSESSPFNETLTWYQFFTMVRPISGRQFELFIRNFPIHSSSEQITPTFTDTMETNINDQLLTLRAGWDGYATNKGLIAVIKDGVKGFWRADSERANERSYGWIWPKQFTSISDCYVEWGEIVERYATPETGNECYTRVGPMVRASG